MQHFAPQSKVWLYQSTRPFTLEEIQQLNTILTDFAVQWTAHNQQLHATGEVVLDRIIMLMVDETHTMASGCSIDTSVHFVKQLEQQFNTSLFNRNIVNYELNGNVQTATIDEFRTKYEAGEINLQTPVYDALVNNKLAFDKLFKVPLADCWLYQIL